VPCGISSSALHFECAAGNLHFFVRGVIELSGKTSRALHFGVTGAKNDLIFTCKTAHTDGTDPRTCVVIMARK